MSVTSSFRYRSARIRSTPAGEQPLLEELTKRNISHKREYPFFNRNRPFFVDVFFREAQLVVEIDGKEHSSKRSDDAARDEHLAMRGIAVLRFTNEEVKSDPVRVVDVIAAVIKQRRQALVAQEASSI